MNIKHPYNFIPLAAPVAKLWWGDGPSGHEKWDSRAHSGMLVCRLKTLTQLCVKAAFEDLKRQHGTPIIPGSSLKGMARSLLQALGAGCGLLYRATDQRLGGLEPCVESGACLVCRLFGYSVEGKEFGWAGKVGFSDAPLCGKWNEGSWEAMPKGGGRWQSNGARHTPFYFSNGKPLGWKVYRHAKNPRAASVAERAKFWTGACVGKDREFEFQVRYENLSSEELAVLHFALTLDHECAEHPREKTFAGHSLAHKLGYGKPAGLGSCAVSVVADLREDPGRYFGEETASPAAVGGNCPLRALLARPGFQKMLEYLAWDARADHLLYPSKDWDQARKGGWFDKNPSATIADYEHDVGGWEMVRITEAGDRVVRSEVERKGRIYRGKSSPGFSGLDAGDMCWVWVTKWDDAGETYEGITA